MGFIDEKGLKRTLKAIDKQIQTSKVTPDWNASSGENEYIHNRTHYFDYVAHLDANIPTSNVFITDYDIYVTYLDKWFFKLNKNDSTKVSFGGPEITICHQFVDNITTQHLVYVDNTNGSFGYYGYGIDIIAVKELNEMYIPDSIVRNTQLEELKTQIIELTYSELLLMQGNYKPGQQYRITDYVTTTGQMYTSSAGHQFDIIVTADNESVLNENAKAIHHEGDTYFENCDLSSWELKYCLKNDNTRFAWSSQSLINSMSVVDSNGNELEVYIDDFIGSTSKYGNFFGYPLSNGSYLVVNISKVLGIFYGGFNEIYLPSELTNAIGTLETITDGNGKSYKIFSATDSITAINVNYEKEYKGVIYYMKDEYGNEAPYDFKNIMFHRYLMVDMQNALSEEWAVNRQHAGLPVAWIGMSENDFPKKKLDDLEATYTYYNNWGEKDFFTFWVSGDDEGSVKGLIKNVKILPTYDVYGKTQQLNNNIFILGGDVKVENVKLGYYNYNNTLRAVSNVEFGNSCAENIVADVSNIKMGNRCYLNIITGSNVNMGDFCSYNTFGPHKINNGCLNCLDKCSYNTFLYGESVTLGVGCEKNSHSIDSAGRVSYSFLTFGDYCKRNGGYISDKSVFNDYVTDVHLEENERALIFMPGTYGTIYADDIPTDNTKNIVVSENGKIKFVNFEIYTTQSITYAELVNLRNNGKLIPGKQYRITDYVTTTTQENTKSAGHQFDVIVLALSDSTLAEEAYAIQRKFNIEDYKDAYSESWRERMIYLDTYDYNGKTYHLYESESQDLQMLVDFDNLGEMRYGTSSYRYTFLPAYAKGNDEEWQDGEEYAEFIGFKTYPNYFANSNLSAWRIWYCLDNDTERFIWADNIGKGVIYRMIDEFNNDVPYDFKNIQFLRGYDQGGLNDKSARKEYLYTFSYMSNTTVDATIYVNAGKVLNDEGLNTGCVGNTIKPFLDYEGQVNPRTPSQRLSDNVFYSSSELEPNGYMGVVGNYVSENCRNNSFNGRITSVYLMPYCIGNRFQNNDFIFLFANTQMANFEDEVYDIQAGSNSNGKTVIKNLFD